MVSHAPIPVPAMPLSMSSTIALKQNAFPTRRHMPANPVQLSPVFLRRSSSAKSGFRSLCGHEQRSFNQLSRSTRPAFWNLSTGVALALENRFPTRFMPGP
jgi:hypothetical protein